MKEAGDPGARLRIVICGSAETGKSTLIDRLVKGRSSAIEDQSRDFATERRSFAIAEASGREQDTRDMAAGALGADLAVLLVDAHKGLLGQARRHAVVASFLGIRFVLLAVNKMDLVDYDQRLFDQISSDFARFAESLPFKKVDAIPISAEFGDNVSSLSQRTPWYSGRHLLDYLETIDAENSRAIKPFRLSVQQVSGPDSDFRGFAGTIVSGGIKRGEVVVALPSGQTSRVETIIGPIGESDSGHAGEAVRVTLSDEIELARGDMIVTPRGRAQVADQFAAHLVWVSTDRLLPGRPYLMKINNNAVGATVTELKHRLDVDTLAKLAAKTLALNEVGVCNLSLARPVAFDASAENRNTGAFILVDRYSNETVAVGTIDFVLRRATNIHYQSLTVSKVERSRLMQHRSVVLWFTGLSGAGKSTIANFVEAGLHARGIHTVMLDGDNVRHGLNRDLGFTEPDRVENIRRIGEVAKLMTDAGLIVLCAFISPFRAERRLVRELLDTGEFLEVFVDTPLDQCIARDPKGLYRRAMAGEIKNFTGVDQPYEVPEGAELHLPAGREPPEKLAGRVIDELVRRSII
jgi:bifunctional enzyme CysN/CysC